jgi:hypothetical protein
VRLVAVWGQDRDDNTPQLIQNPELMEDILSLRWRARRKVRRKGVENPPQRPCSANLSRAKDRLTPGGAGFTVWGRLGPQRVLVYPRSVGVLDLLGAYHEHRDLRIIATTHANSRHNSHVIDTVYHNV